MDDDWDTYFEEEEKPDPPWMQLQRIARKRSLGILDYAFAQWEAECSDLAPLMDLFP